MANKAIIGLGVAAGLAGIVLIATRAKAAPLPPGGYVCPYDGLSFDTYDELVAHVLSVHPGQRIPINITWQ